MRSFAVTALIAAGLLGVAPHAQAAGSPARQPGSYPQPDRSSYALNITGQATHWQLVPGELQVVRWTLKNTGNRRLEQVQLAASVPAGWTIREGQGCARHGAYLNCELGPLDPGRDAAVIVPMVAQRPLGPVRLAAWSRAMAGSQVIPGPTTSFRVFVVAHR